MPDPINKPSLPALSPQSEDQNEIWRRAVASSLTRLATHYHRPGLVAEQVRHAMLDFFQDLAQHTPAAIEDACAAYRRNPDNRFFPTPGALLAILRDQKPGSPPAMRRHYEPQPQDNSNAQVQAMRSVSDILRAKGFTAAANAYEARKTNKPQEPT